jgi:hypothetical protein
LGERPWVLHAWLRSGNTSSARGADAFLDETLALLPPGVNIAFLRADSGYGIEPFLSKVENHKFLYTIVARFTKGLKNEVAKVQTWQELEPGIAVAETVFQAQGWKKIRRVGFWCVKEPKTKTLSEAENSLTIRRTSTRRF